MVKKINKILESKQVGLKTFLSNVFYVYFRDVLRIIKNPLLVVVLLGALILPCLYAWFTISANWDPYSNTKNIKVAVVNEDKGVDSDIGGHLNIGSSLREKLETNSQIGWTFTDLQDAFTNLESGQYYAVIVLQENFSSNLAKIFTDPNNRDFIKLEYYVNERENGAAVKITDTASSAIEQQINSQFVGKVTQVVSEKACEIAGSVVIGVEASTATLSDRINMIAGNASGLVEILDQGQGTISQAKDTIYKIILVLDSVKNESDKLYEKLEESKQACNNSRTNINNLIEELKKTGIDWDYLITILSNFESAISDVSSTLAEVSSVLFKISFTCQSVINELNTSLNMLSETSTTASNFAEKIQGVHDILLDLSNAINSNLAGSPELLKDIVNSDSSNIGNFMSSPVKLESQILNKINNNGSAISPFFTNLSIWILGIVLIALFRTEVEPPKRKYWTASQAYVARGLLFSTAGIISSIFCSLGNLFIIGIQCENFIMYILSCMIIAFVYVNIIYMLAACFKHVGRAIACILIIMQIPGSAGMFPIQLTPEGFQNIYPFLPFTYGISALRECIISIDYLYWFLDVIALFIFFILSFAVGLYAREGLRGLNKLFDDELAKNTIMICDAEDHVSDNVNTMETVVENLNDNEEAKNLTYALDVVRQKYKKKSRYGLIFLIVVPQLLLIVVSIVMNFIYIDINVVLTWLAIWMILTIVIATYVIINEYKYKKLLYAEKKSIKKINRVNNNA